MRSEPVVCAVPQDPPRTGAYLTLAALALVWGSSYILIKESLVALSAYQVGCLRMTLAAAAFAPAAWRHCRGLSAKRLGTLAVVGLCGTGLPSLLFPLAQRTLSSSLAAALSSLTPLMTAAISVAAFGLVVTRWRLLGVAVGLAGALTLVAGRYGWPTGGRGEAWPTGAILLAIGGTVCYALSSNLVKRYLPASPPLQVTAGAMAPLGPLGVGGLVIGGGLPLTAAAAGIPDAGALVYAYAAVAFLALVGTAAASYLFFRLVQLTDPVFASSVSYLVPIVALGWGLLAGEVVNVAIVGGLALVLAGVWLSGRRDSRT